MEEFTDLNSLYIYLEKNATNYKYPYEIGLLFRKLRNYYNEEKKIDEVEMAQWEIDFFNFIMEEGKFKVTNSMPNEKGEIVVYPTLDRFDSNTYDYLIERLNNTSNPLLKARYSHILWCSPKKHAKYAKIAVDSYLELISIYETMDMKEPDKHYGLLVLDVAKNAYFIACYIENNIPKVKYELDRLVRKFNPESSSAFALKFDIMKVMLKDKKRFEKRDFIGYEKICLEISKSLIQRGNIHFAIDMLGLGEKIDQKLGKKTHNWRKQIAESYEILMNREEKDNNLASLSSCQSALENYKRIKNKEKIRELEKKYLELKKSIKFAEYEIKIDLTAHIENCKKIAGELAQRSPEEIIQFLIYEKDLLPKYEVIEKEAEEYRKQSLAEILPRVILDQYGHIAQHFNDEEEKKYFAILQQYRLDLEINRIPLINEIFIKTILENKLSSKNLLGFLKMNSWFGKDIPKRLPSGETVTYNWLNLIAPSIHEYFLQMHYYFLNRSNFPNLILCIDSLVLKIEGLFRDLCQFCDITTFNMTQDNKGRDISREKDIGGLLNEEKIKEFLDKDDLLFLKFLLVEHAGYKLRHKVAHSLMIFQEYNINLMHLLILAILKLGKYDLIKNGDSAPQKII